MKRLAIVVLSLFVFTACEKEEVEIPLADQVMGDYTMNTFQTDNGSLPLPFTSSTGSIFSVRVVVTKVSETTVDFNVISKTEENGISLSQPAISRGITLTKTDAGVIKLNNPNDGKTISEVNGSNISVFGSLEG